MLPYQMPRYNGKMTVVLDMDETLLHSVFLKDIATMLRRKTGKQKITVDKEQRLIRKLTKTADLLLTAKVGDVAVYFRPGLHRFLCKLSRICEVVVWTAGSRDYAQPILDHIDPSGKLIPYRLFREHCVQSTDLNLNCIKDLQLLGRNMKRTLLVDNNPNVALVSPNNCTIVESFYGDPNDQHLEKMWKFIDDLSGYLDIRIPLKITMDFQNTEISKPGILKKQKRCKQTKDCC